MVAAGRIVVAYRVNWSINRRYLIKGLPFTEYRMHLQGSLYDMTHFTGHPGGVGRLQMAAGNDLEVYWRVYTRHNRC